MIQMTQEQKTAFTRLAIIIGIFIAIFLLLAIASKAKQYRYIGSSSATPNTITVVGEGEVNKAPDTAKISFSVNNEQKDLKTAQNNVSQKVQTITDALKASGIEEKDIKTEGYNSYPQYDYPKIMCITAPCQTASPVLRGYEVSQNININVTDLEKVPDVLSLLGKNNVTNISGPNFGFEDDKAIEREARDLAIEDAKSEAQKLAKSLGVKLVRIVSFSDNSTPNYPVPAYSLKQEAGNMASDSVSLPVGEHNVKSSVNLVYEIK